MYYPYPEMTQIVPTCYTWPQYGCFQQPQYAIPPSPDAVQQIADFNSQWAARRAMEEQHNQTELNHIAAKNEIELRMEVAKKKINVAANDENIMHRSDLNALSEMNISRVEITSDGHILYTKKGFERDAELQVPFSLQDYIILTGAQGDRKVLAVGYNIKKRRNGLYIWSDRLDDRTISRKFDGAGLTCGLSRERERNFRRLLIQKCMSTAEEQWIPKRHGWYMRNEEMQFAFPEALTWKEVTQFADN